MCVFCSIVKGELDSYKVYENNDFIVILDKYPVSKGHLLIVTKEHFEAISDTPPNLVAEAFKLAGGIAKYYRKELHAPGVNVVTNDGVSAGQEVFHFHVHVIPRWERIKGLFSGRTVLTEEMIEDSYRMLKALPEYLDRYLS
ncbi:MAG: HIT family protein [Desulfurococcales archaeon]|nr:HIT family protein [Desulfurococcales archaeon]